EISGLKKPRGFMNRVVRRSLGMRPIPPPKYRLLILMATNTPQALDEALLRPGRIDRIYKVGYPSKAGRIRTYRGYLAKVRHDLVIDIATIEKGGSYLGMVASIPPEDQFVQWRSEYEADILTTLASLAGERIFFDGDNSSGVGGDLESATKIATLMEGYWGMGSTVASHGVTHEVGI